MLLTTAKDRMQSANSECFALDFPLAEPGFKIEIWRRGLNTWPTRDGKTDHRNAKWTSQRFANWSLADSCNTEGSYGKSRAFMNSFVQRNASCPTAVRWANPVRIKPTAYGHATLKGSAERGTAGRSAHNELFRVNAISGR